MLARMMSALTGIPIQPLEPENPIWVSSANGGKTSGDTTRWS
jgi:hypothetical protein